MPSLKTCLLISDDPDDHFEFSEALHETSPDLVLVSIFNGNKIPDLLQGKRIVPDYIFLDLSMTEPQLGQIEAVLKTVEGLKNIMLVSYGSDNNGNISTTLSKDYTYSELKEFLKRILSSTLEGAADH